MATSAAIPCGYLLKDASREERNREKLIAICCLGLLWLKNVNQQGECGLMPSLTQKRE